MRLSKKEPMTKDYGRCYSYLRPPGANIKLICKPPTEFQKQDINIYNLQHGENKQLRSKGNCHVYLPNTKYIIIRLSEPSKTEKGNQISERIKQAYAHNAFITMQ